MLKYQKYSVMYDFVLLDFVFILTLWILKDKHIQFHHYRQVNVALTSNWLSKRKPFKSISQLVVFYRIFSFFSSVVFAFHARKYGLLILFKDREYKFWFWRESCCGVIFKLFQAIELHKRLNVVIFRRHLQYLLHSTC